MKDKIPNQKYNYSDHVGLQVDLTIKKELPSTKKLLGEASFIDNGTCVHVINSPLDI